MSTRDGDHDLIASAPPTRAGEEAGDPRPAAVTFVTTEHFTLQGERSRAISELTATGWPFRVWPPDRGKPFSRSREWSRSSRASSWGPRPAFLVAVVSDHSLTAALAIGGVATVATLWGLWRRGQAGRKRQTSTEELSPYA